MATSAHQTKKSDVSFVLSAPGNSKEHPDFENHTLHSPKYVKGEGGVQIVGWGQQKCQVSISQGSDKSILI